MNISKYKHWKSAIAVAVVFVFFIHTPLQAASEQRGAMVAVTLTLGRGTVKGELLSVKEDALLIFDHSTGRGERIELQDVSQVKIIKKSKFLLGMVIGIIIGLRKASYNVRYEDSCEAGYGMDYFLIPPLTGLCGGILGALAGIDKKFSLAGILPQIRQENLERLKDYAREQDYEKPIETVSADIIYSTFKIKRRIPRARQQWHRHRFGLLWLPGNQNISKNIDFRGENGTFRFVNNSPLQDTTVYSCESVSESFPSDLWRAGQLRMEFEWTPYFSSSLEFISSGKMYGKADINLNYYSNEYSRQYQAFDYFNNDYLYNCLLLGLNWKSLSPSFANRNIFELGIAAGPAQTQVKMNCNLYSPNSNPPQKYRALTWTCKAHAAYDHFLTDNFSLGGFISYQYLRASFPGVTIVNKEQEFGPKDYDSHIPHFTRSVEFTIPKHNIQLGGATFGIRVGVRF
jgi:hypothetical protein